MPESCLGFGMAGRMALSDTGWKENGLLWNIGTAYQGGNGKRLKRLLGLIGQHAILEGKGSGCCALYAIGGFCCSTVPASIFYADIAITSHTPLSRKGKKTVY